MKLLELIEKLKKSNIQESVNLRISQFKETGSQPINKIFSELCFCILTANSSAERCISVQNKVNTGFLELTKEHLIQALKKNSCRFHTKRASYILEARQHLKELTNIISQDSQKAREWLVKNIKGIGYKESSHFLRNIGHQNLAIIDFHIIDLLVKHNLTEKPKTLTKKEYFKLEDTLRTIATNTQLSLAELDLYLWYMETGKVLK
ncbi:N-glycosylase [Candidatus Woesearchaeota archaeon]|nr:N-glycosylase [Candidatus Woesearchaeota archaeon]|tara:strand:- start:1177 stop:1794 length:618 start_codon:yes stop_codon:yes gene_type:complete